MDSKVKSLRRFKGLIILEYLQRKIASGDRRVCLRDLLFLGGLFRAAMIAARTGKEVQPVLIEGECEQCPHCKKGFNPVKLKIHAEE